MEVDWAGSTAFIIDRDTEKNKGIHIRGDIAL